MARRQLFAHEAAAASVARALASRYEHEGWISGAPRSMPPSRPTNPEPGKYATMKAQRPRVFLGFQETAGYYGNLKRGLDELGIPSAFACFKNRYSHALAGNPAWLNRVNSLAQASSRACGRSLTGRALWSVFLRHVVGLPTILWALPRYDVFVFCSFSTAFYFLDLPLLKLFNKKIIFVFHGSDTRPVYLNGFHLPELTYGQVALGLARTRLQKAGVWMVDRFADQIVSIPPQAHFHGRPIVSHYFVGIPCDIDEDGSPGDASVDDGRIRILHAPTQPKAKGSALIRRAVERMRARGHSTELIELTGRPHREVVAELRRCSFVIDQSYSDTPMAGFATEAAFFGKPAIVGGYYSQVLPSVLPSDVTPPTLYCLPEELEAAIEKMIADRPFREDLGRRARAFVRTRWAPRQVAERFLALAANEFPEAWLFDPNDITYVEGAGLSRADAARRVRAYVEAGGTSSLCVSDKPALLASLLELGRNPALETPPVAT